MAFDPTPGFNLGISDSIRKAIPVFGISNGKPSVTSLQHSVKNRNGGGGADGGTGDRPQKAVTESPPTNASVLGAQTGSSGTYNPADLAYLDSQAGILRDMLGRSQNALNQGLTNLNDSYNRQVGSANQQRSRALEDFGVQREDTTRAKQEALGKVDTNARTLNDSLRRILGMAGGSESSAYQYAAPNAVARQASGERNDVLSGYAENDRSIGLAERRAEEDFASLLSDLAAQRGQKESELRTGILENEQDTNRSLADIAAQRSALQGGGYAAALAAQRPYADAISSRQSQLDNLFNQFRNPVLTPKAVNVQKPELRDYLVDRAGINAQQQAPTTDAYSPYSPFLKKQQEEV